MENILAIYKTGNLRPNSDKDKGMKAVYEVDVDRDIGKGEEAEPLLLLGMDMDARARKIIGYYGYTLEVFGELTNGFGLQRACRLCCKKRGHFPPPFPMKAYGKALDEIEVSISFQGSMHMPVPIMMITTPVEPQQWHPRLCSLSSLLDPIREGKMTCWIPYQFSHSPHVRRAVTLLDPQRLNSKLSIFKCALVVAQ